MHQLYFLNKIARTNSFFISEKHFPKDHHCRCQWPKTFLRETHIFGNLHHYSIKVQYLIGYHIKLQNYFAVYKRENFIFQTFFFDKRKGFYIKHFDIIVMSTVTEKKKKSFHIKLYSYESNSWVNSSNAYSFTTFSQILLV